MIISLVNVPRAVSRTFLVGPPPTPYLNTRLNPEVDPCCGDPSTGAPQDESTRAISPKMGSATRLISFSMLSTILRPGRLVTSSNDCAGKKFPLNRVGYRRASFRNLQHSYFPSQIASDMPE